MNYSSPDGAPSLRSPFEGHSAALERLRRVPFLLYGILCLACGLSFYLVGVLMAFPRQLFGLNRLLLPLNEWIVWYSGIPIAAGVVLTLADLLLLFPMKRRTELRFDPPRDPKVTVALTAYNDEQSIAEVVHDFLQHRLVRNVIVVSNNSADATLERARTAGAITFNEPVQGYGQCVYRCLSEALRLDDTELIVVCEGDRTFRAYDLEKLLAYAPHADIVNGTRIVEPLRARRTQLTTLMYYGNLFVAKLLEAKHLGRSTLTDVGTTYKLCRRPVLERLLSELDPRINLEFNAYFLDKVLQLGALVVECPITFHLRTGVSKGGNASDRRALRVGMRMMGGIIFGWRPGCR